MDRSRSNASSYYLIYIENIKSYSNFHYEMKDLYFYLHDIPFLGEFHGKIKQIKVRVFMCKFSNLQNLLQNPSHLSPCSTAIEFSPLESPWKLFCVYLRTKD